MAGCGGCFSFLGAKKNKGPVEFGYWQIRGLGSVFRMLLEYAGADYTDRQYASGQEWFKGRKPDILKMNPLANLPYLVDGDVCVCQTNTLLHYLGEKFGLSGATPEARRLNDELLNEIYDVRNAVIELSYPFKKVSRDEQEYRANALAIVEKLPFGKFEDVLARRGTDFFCGKTPCTSDFHIWEMLDQHRLLCEQMGASSAFLSEFPKCTAFYERFRALPQLQRYFASDAYKLPVNNPIANAWFQ
mmetsp:Transcript_67137/g.151755  ORF Transcript_67137/g.151755 Transcript_67137/m.151755 type:complete len:245 (-) Transcript_67137:268-1002(-)